jgi:hypothetical protein
MMGKSKVEVGDAIVGEIGQKKIMSDGPRN